MIPPFADVICDCRALPGQSLDDVREQLDRALDGIAYELELLEPLEGGTESPTDTPLYAICEEYVRERLPGAELLPIVTPGFTDSHWVRQAHGTVAYGFAPVFSTPLPVYLDGVHGADEAIDVADLAEMTALQPRRCSRTRLARPRSTPSSVATTSSPIVVEVVAALLDDRGRQPEAAEQLAGAAVALGGDLERALGIAAGGVDAERDDDAADAGRACELAEAATASSHGPSPEPGASGRFRFAPSPSPPPRSSAKPRKWGNQPAPGSTWTEPVATVASSQKIDCVPLPWWASMSRIGDRPAEPRRAARPAAAAALFR